MRRLGAVALGVGIAKALDAITTYFALQQPGTAENLPITRWAIALFGLELGLVIVTVLAVVGTLALIVVIERVTTPMANINGVPKWYPSAAVYGSAVTIAGVFVLLAIQNTMFLV